MENKEQSSLEKGINVLDTDEDIQEFTIEQYECSKKAIIVALADQKVKIRKLFNKHITCSCGWNEQVTKKHQFLKKFEELKQQ